MPIKAAYIVPHPPLIVPEVGRGKEKIVEKTIDSYNIIAKKIGGIKPDIIILISPHAKAYSDYIKISPDKKAQGSLKRFGAPEVYKAEYHSVLIDEIMRVCDNADFPAGAEGEWGEELDHGTLVPLHFINKYHTDYKLVRCSISGLSRQEHYRFGMIIKEAVESFDNYAKIGRDVVIIASGDLSHKLTKDGPYGFAPEGPELDKKLTDIMRSADFGEFFNIDSALCERGAECGLMSFIIMAGALDKTKVETNFLSYEGVSGVGYAVCEYTVTGEDNSRDFLSRNLSKIKGDIEDLRNNEDALVRLARKTLESYVASGKTPELPDNDNLPDESDRPDLMTPILVIAAIALVAGVFLVLKSMRIVKAPDRVR